MTPYNRLGKLKYVHTMELSYSKENEQSYTQHG